MIFGNSSKTPCHGKLISIAISVLLVSSLSAASAQENIPPPKIGEMAPPYTLERLLQAPPDVELSHEKLKNNIVVLEFWATWCGPCRKAIPHLNELIDKFSQKPVLFISITDEEEWKVKNYLKVTPISGWIGFDTDNSMFKAYGIQLIPETVIIDRNGRIAAIMSPDLVQAELLEKLLEGKALAETQQKAMPASPKKENEENIKVEPPLLEVTLRPARPSVSMSLSGRTFKARGMTLHKIVSLAYEISPLRLIASTPLADDTYEVIINIPAPDRNALLSLLRQSLETAFGLKIHRETREMTVFVLRSPKDKKTLLRPSEFQSGMPIMSDDGQITSQGASIQHFCPVLEDSLRKIVIDETGLKDFYNIALYWKPDDPLSAISAVRDQLGLELKTEIRSVEVMVYETKPSTIEK